MGRPNQKSRTRKDLLRAAARLMKAGRSPALEEVAADAMVSRATAYRYFPTQAALVQAAVDEALGPILRWRSDSDDAETRVEELLGFAYPRIDEYEATLRDLLRRAVDATGCQLIMATPYLIEPDRAEPKRAMSDRYGAVVRALADEVGAKFVDTQEAFDRVLAVTAPAAWADDRVHPNLPGHAVLAEAFLRTIDP